ncbi:(S)-benzoin forming benzil reductase [Alkalihalophilus marmarensis]|uniref:(S)-benzoin forming benzil reductase n=1 Tax=Alkalihalophilus marmarensis TaxID=521377 RepID=UPI002E1FB48A|nr:(S)-benzoin forming benzil reductase [Alkalihalophilus marmarensis]MED1599943.1 (S)-benzoin forming benzil reductase [Alkalihalophilus marmarensis]
MNYLIITGGTRGLGEEIVKSFAKEDTHIISIARGENQELQALVEDRGGKFTPIQFDLADIEKVENLMEEVFHRIDKKSAKSIHLVNNAGIVAPIKPIERCEAEVIIKSQHVNLVAPMLMISSFCKMTASLHCEKRVINVSSGAAKRPIFGWSSYGSSKAGLDLFSQGAALDQEKTEHPVKVLSFYPGIMDTDMQAEIRSSAKEDFINVETFQNYKEEGKLLPPKQVAEVVVQLLETDSFPNGEVVAVQDYL